jgi:hypothetical protein
MFRITDILTQLHKYDNDMACRELAQDLEKHYGGTTRQEVETRYQACIDKMVTFINTKDPKKRQEHAIEWSKMLSDLRRDTNMSVLLNDTSRIHFVAKLQTLQDEVLKAMLGVIVASVDWASEVQLCQQEYKALAQLKDVVKKQNRLIELNHHIKTLRIDAPEDIKLQLEQIMISAASDVLGVSIGL